MYQAYLEKVSIEKTESGTALNFQHGSKYPTEASVHDAEYIGRKLGWLGYLNGQLRSTTYSRQQIVDDIDSVIETTPEQIKIARGQIEDAGGEVDNYSELDIAIMDFRMREAIANSAKEIDDPWNPTTKLGRGKQIVIDYPDPGYLFEK